VIYNRNSTEWRKRQSALEATCYFNFTDIIFIFINHLKCFLYLNISVLSLSVTFARAISKTRQNYSMYGLWVVTCRVLSDFTPLCIARGHSPVLREVWKVETHRLHIIGTGMKDGWTGRKERSFWSGVNWADAVSDQCISGLHIINLV
jgi:hypothetical protein